MKALVCVTFEIEIDVPKGWDEHDVRFNVEENSCMATSNVGAAFTMIRELHDDAGTCWGCALNCEQRVVSIDGKLVEES